MRKYVVVWMCVVQCLLFTCTKVWSQSTINLGVNLGVGNKGFPVNDKLGLGSSVEYMGRVWNHGGIRMYMGYDWFDQSQPKNIDPRVLRDSLSRYPNLFADKSFLPIRLGYQQLLFQDAAFIYFEAGIVRWRPQNSNKSNSFTYAFGTGYKFRLKEKQFLQLSLIYNQNIRKAPDADVQRATMNNNYFTLRAAYGLLFHRKAK
jgi:hypothetical protein